MSERETEFVSDEWTFACEQCERCGGLDFLSLMIRDNGELICSDCIIEVMSPSFDHSVTRRMRDNSPLAIAGLMNLGGSGEGRD